MIILDTCILRTFNLDSSSADLLRTIRTVGREGVAVPWMAREELVAQQAVKYRQHHDAAARTIDSLTQLTPWDLQLSVGPCDLERVREHWRDRYSSVVDTIPTSESALRDGLFREANALAPCKMSDGPRSKKSGSRDAAIWLSAVEYARDNPDETVYFVSANTKDFRDGTSYVSPMDEDVRDLGARFVHLTSMDELVNRFTGRTETDQDLVRAILNSESVLTEMDRAAQLRMGANPHLVRTECTAAIGQLGTDLVTASAIWFVTTTPVFTSVADAETYKIGEHEWCTATVQWSISGLAVLADAELSIAAAACSWTTSVLFTPDVDHPRLTVLRSDPPRAISEEEFNALKVSRTTPGSLLSTLGGESWRKNPSSPEYLRGLRARGISPELERVIMAYLATLKGPLGDVDE
ncbi:PIN domain-containing protein [Streptomyces sp. NPDC056352]|uniref:PIN domain-containing protein n=1 Tax=Streptomyces sp. NPDC056352 TaxID=3345791 RepID=UPI0035DB9262